MTRAWLGRWLPHGGISVRLTALVAVPLAALSVLATNVLVDTRSAADRAGEIEMGAPAATELAALVHAFELEQAATQILLGSGELGFDPEPVFDLLGPAFEPTRARSAVDALATEHLGPVDAASLRAVRAAVDAGRLTSADSDRRYGGLGEHVRADLAATVADLQRRATGLADGEDLTGSLAALVALVDALAARGVQFLNVAPLYLGDPSVRAQAAAAVSRGSEALAAARQQLAVVDPDLAARWMDLERHTAVGIVDRAASLVADGVDPRAELSVDDLILVADSGARFQSEASALVAQTGGRVERTAAAMEAAADHRARVAGAGLLGTIVVTLLLAGWLARSITKPLLRLSAGAAAVRDGELDVPALAPSGPNAVRVVAGAFNDLVANLRLLESKGQALAAADFENPVLGEPLPGRLGESIQASVTMLAGSVAERDRLQRRLLHQATHDSLTGLANRAAAIDALDGALARARRGGDPVAVLFVDLDGFKAINDTHGHDLGDQVLREIAHRVLAAVRQGDVVARLGGDEFLVVAEHADAEVATVLARRMVDAVSEPIAAGGRTVTLAASVGIALSLDGTGEPAVLLGRADLALYRAKARGRACVELFDESLQREQLRRSEIEAALGSTLARGGDELVLHYQPVVDVCDGTVRAVEALVRWARPGEGLVAPDSFIPVAETSDLILDIDAWVLRAAASQAARWVDGPALSVNVSGRHLLSERLYDNVLGALEATGLPPGRLIVEVTETVLLSDMPVAAAQLAALQAVGVRVAVDDFGTGYTSLAALQALPADIIKIDRSFIARITETRHRSLVALVTQLGHQLGVTVVAEGVETAEQRATLEALGCDEIQGYLVSRPVPEASLAEFVVTGAPRGDRAPTGRR